MKKIAAILCAAGRSRRFGGKRKKPFAEVQGRAAFLRCVELFADRDDMAQIIVAIAPEDEELFRLKWSANLSFFGAQTCLGGDCRGLTVHAALQKLRDDIDGVVIHDASRCCLTADLLDRTITAAAKTGVAVPVAPVSIRIKRRPDPDSLQTVATDDLVEAQTPQVFSRSILTTALQQFDHDAWRTFQDDLQIAERLGAAVTTVEADPYNINLTFPRDVALAEAILRTQPQPKPEGPAGPYFEARW